MSTYAGAEWMCTVVIPPDGRPTFLYTLPSETSVHIPERNGVRHSAILKVGFILGVQDHNRESGRLWVAFGFAGIFGCFW